MYSAIRKQLDDVKFFESGMYPAFKVHVIDAVLLAKKKQGKKKSKLN